MIGTGEGLERWFTAAELAGLPGVPKSERRVRDKATREEWQSRPRTGQGGGREYHCQSLPLPTWKAICKIMVAEDTQPKTIPWAPGAIPVNMLPDGAQARARLRLDMLCLLDEFREDTFMSRTEAERAFAEAWNRGEIEAREDLREAFPTVSWNSLARWRRHIHAGAAHKLGGRRARSSPKQSVIDKNPYMREQIISRIEHQPNVNSRQVREWLLARNVPPEAIPCKRRLNAWMSRYRWENRVTLGLLNDPDRARSRYQPAFGSASAGIERLNQLWELDATPADVMLKDGRHVVVGVIDVFSRRGRVLVVPSSRAAAVLALMRRAILEWGVPEAVKTDNGKDFVAGHVTHALGKLQITHRLCKPFTPEAKPHIERFLGTLMHDLVEQLPGYIGHNGAERQAIRGRESFAKRFGKGDETVEVALTAEEFQRACDTWCHSVYERREHGGLDGATPHLVALQNAADRKVIRDERALDVLLMPLAGGGGWRSVGKHGLKVQGAVYVAPELGGMVGERVRVHLDPADAGRVCVYDSEGAFVAWAEAPERAGVDLGVIARQTRQVHRQMEREARADARQRKRAYRPEDAWRDVLDGAEARAEGDTVVGLPAREAEHASPGLAEAAEAAAPRRPEEITDEELEAAKRWVAETENAAAARAVAHEQELRAAAREMVQQAEERSTNS